MWSGTEKVLFLNKLLINFANLSFCEKGGKVGATELAFLLKYCTLLQITDFTEG